MPARPRLTILLPHPTRGPLVAVVLAALVIVVAAPNVAVQTVERPRYLATAILADGSDVNLQVFADRAVSEPVTYDASGHGELPSWTATLPVLPGQAVPWAPRMDWPVEAYMDPVGSGQRPLRYCADALRQFDAEHGDATTAIAVTALVAKFAGPFNSGQSFAVRAPVEDCSRPDIVLHADADSRTIGCWQPDTLACAALLFEDGRPVTYVSFGGGLRRAGTLPDRCVEAAIWHEGGHGGALGHSGRYGGEGHRHAHASDMGYMDLRTCRPEDNPADAPAIEDWQSQSGTYTGTPGFCKSPGRPRRSGRQLRRSPRFSKANFVVTAR